MKVAAVRTTSTVTRVTSESITVSFSDGAWSGFFSSAGLAVVFGGQEVVATGGEGLQITEEAVVWEGVELSIEPASALVGTEQLVRVRGDVRGAAVDCLGQLSRRTALDLTAVALVRYVGAWLGDGEGIVLEAQRPSRAKAHGDEEIWAALIEGGEPVAVFDPRLSTTYDGDGHQRRAGLELWTTAEEGYPIRAAGQVICGSSLDLGELVLDLAFFRWTAHGAEGIGRYDILRKRG